LWFIGEPVRVLLTDNGSEFAGRFDAACRRHAMVRYYSRPRRPTDNPECERFNQTLQREWLDIGNESLDVSELNRTLAEWLATYNSVRPHHSLGLRTPLVVAEESGLLSETSPASTLRASARLPSHSGGDRLSKTDTPDPARR
jgi:transposase InsO family protein